MITWITSEEIALDVFNFYKGSDTQLCLNHSKDFILLLKQPLHVI